MDYKVVVSDGKTGKSYQVEAKDEVARKIKDKKIGDVLEGTIIGLPGFKLQITGGSDKSGFPMKTGLHTPGAARILMGDGVGFKAERGHRARRRVHGEIVGDDMVQINMRIKEYGSKDIDTILGKPKEEKPAEEKK